MGFKLETNQLIQPKRPDTVNRKKKRNSQIIDVAVPVELRIKTKENEKRDKYLDLARERKNLLDMKMMVIPL